MRSVDLAGPIDPKANHGLRESNTPDVNAAKELRYVSSFGSNLDEIA